MQEGLCAGGYVHRGIDEWVFADVCVQLCVGIGARA